MLKPQFLSKDCEKVLRFASKRAAFEPIAPIDLIYGILEIKPVWLSYIFDQTVKIQPVIRNSDLSEFESAPQEPYSSFLDLICQQFSLNLQAKLAFEAALYYLDAPNKVIESEHLFLGLLKTKCDFKIQQDDDLETIDSSIIQKKLEAVIDGCACFLAGSGKDSYKLDVAWNAHNAETFSLSSSEATNHAGYLVRKLPVTHYKDMRLDLEIDIKTKKASQAWFWSQIDLLGEAPIVTTIRLAPDSNWSTLLLNLSIPKNAYQLSYGPKMRGIGSCSISNIRVKNTTSIQTMNHKQHWILTGVDRDNFVLVPQSDETLTLNAETRDNNKLGVATNFAPVNLWRGKKVALEATIICNNVKAAGLYLAAVTSSHASRDVMEKNFLTGSSTGSFRIVIIVPEETQTLSFGFWQKGAGSVTLYSPQFTVASDSETTTGELVWLKDEISFLL
jgi:hypothetical protein